MVLYLLRIRKNVKDSFLVEEGFLVCCSVEDSGVEINVFDVVDRSFQVWQDCGVNFEDHC